MKSWNFLEHGNMSIPRYELAFATMRAFKVKSGIRRRKAASFF